MAYASFRAHIAALKRGWGDGGGGGGVERGVGEASRAPDFIWTRGGQRPGPNRPGRASLHHSHTALALYTMLSHSVTLCITRRAALIKKTSTKTLSSPFPPSESPSLRSCLLPSILFPSGCRCIIVRSDYMIGRLASYRDRETETGTEAETES